MMILALDSGLDTDPAKIDALLTEDVARVWELHAEGTLRAIYQRGDNPFAVLILECADLDEARAKLGTIPFVKAGITTFDTVIPLQPFTGFRALFSPERSSGAPT